MNVLKEVIKAEGVVLSYKESVIVKCNRFVVNEGDFVCISGLNGSGKSTFLKALAGQCDPEIHFEGKIEFLGNSVDDTQTAFKGRVVFIKQVPEFKEEYGTVKDEFIAGVGYKNYKNSRQSIVSFFSNFISEKDFSVLEKTKIERLNEGHKKLLYILLKLYLNPEAVLFLIDEPLNYLDYKFAPGINDLLNRVMLKGNTAIVFVSHCKMFAKPNRQYLIENHGFTEVEYHCLSCFGNVDNKGNYGVLK